MSHDRTTDQSCPARVVGALFILATVTAVVGGSLITPITEDGADLVALHGQVNTGAVLEALLALSVIAIAVLLPFGAQRTGEPRGRVARPRHPLCRA